MPDKKKLCICVGINYVQLPKLRLFGCIHDAKVMAGAMKTRGYETRIYDDNNPVTQWATTHAGLEKIFKTIVKDSFSYDTIWFHYSGHGSQTPDLSGYECDGLDEALVTTDPALFTDDEICEILQNINPKCVLNMTFDCCHSGTMVDLPYMYNGSRTGVDFKKVIRSPLELPASVSCISACKDSQVAYEQNREGVLTTEFLYLLANRQDLHGSLKDFFFALNERVISRFHTQHVTLSTNYHINNKTGLFVGGRDKTKSIFRKYCHLR